MTVSVTVSLPNLQVPVVDRKTMLMDPTWYRWFEKIQQRTGGDDDLIATNTTNIALKANKDITIILGNGLTGGGDLSNDVNIAAIQDTGWTAGTGTPNKGAYAAYAGQTVSVSYVQAEAQQTDDAVKALAARVLALEQALLHNGGIGP